MIELSGVGPGARSNDFMAINQLYQSIDRSNAPWLYSLFILLVVCLACSSHADTQTHTSFASLTFGANHAHAHIHTIWQIHTALVDEATNGKYVGRSN